MTIANITDNHMTNLVERFYDNVDENDIAQSEVFEEFLDCLLYTSPSPRDRG